MLRLIEDEETRRMIVDMICTIISQEDEETLKQTIKGMDNVTICRLLDKFSSQYETLEESSFANDYLANHDSEDLIFMINDSEQELGCEFAFAYMRARNS